jgi:hypothetical protein
MLPILYSFLLLYTFYMFFGLYRKFQAPRMAPVTVNLGQKMSHNVPAVYDVADFIRCQPGYVPSWKPLARHLKGLPIGNYYMCTNIRALRRQYAAAYCRRILSEEKATRAGKMWRRFAVGMEHSGMT